MNEAKVQRRTVRKTEVDDKTEIIFTEKSFMIYITKFRNKNSLLCALYVEAFLRFTEWLKCLSLPQQIKDKQGLISAASNTYIWRFIMFSVVTNIYNKIVKGLTLMELLTVTGKLKKFFLTTRKFDVCTTGDTANIDTILKFLPHTR
jgi:hypothetical protein